MPEPAPEPAGISIRAARPDEIDAVVVLAGRALGWDPGRPNGALFRWKHLDNPFGPSPMWVAEADGALVGFRCALRWRFRRADGTVATAARMVDTATHPDHQGRGIFTALTRHALETLRSEGTDFVFNTPNTQSRPGYVKMGWQVVGRVPVGVGVTGARGATRVVRARQAAEKWSQPCSLGVAAAEAFADTASTAALLERIAPPLGYVTDRSPEHLLWRYRFAPLHYRVIPVGGDLRDGAVVFRLRRRGAALEATVAELLVPTDTPEMATRLLCTLRRRSGADYLIAARPRPPIAAGFVPLPRQGPVLTWRSVAQTAMPRLGAWHLSLGDVELF